MNNILKDLKLADKQAIETGATLPMASVAVAKYSKATENGDGDKDFSVIALELERENNVSS